ncbi:hypothetical protein NPIL_705051 [Nephila pilipes]|uniref:Uncharacterized protein n=1 Tax=Nephila pilipes TaxID=299642 RepID=A0A8X6QD58_NEPPI|nr:hypothetical protein NPIL_705051 [Nephila pilipes]
MSNESNVNRLRPTRQKIARAKFGFGKNRKPRARREKHKSPDERICHRAGNPIMLGAVSLARVPGNIDLAMFFSVEGQWQSARRRGSRLLKRGAR